MKGVPITPRERNRVDALIASGATDAEIAAITGRAAKTIRNIRRVAA